MHLMYLQSWHVRKKVIPGEKAHENEIIDDPLKIKPTILREICDFHV